MCRGSHVPLSYVFFLSVVFTSVRRVTYDAINPPLLIINNICSGPTCARPCRCWWCERFARPAALQPWRPMSRSLNHDRFFSLLRCFKSEHFFFVTLILLIWTTPSFHKMVTFGVRVLIIYEYHVYIALLEPMKEIQVWSDTSIVCTSVMY